MTDDPNAIMVFAAGFGTRMGALTKQLPKPLIRVGGVTLIDRTLQLTKDIAPNRIVANTHYRADQMARHLRPKSVLLSHEQQILETGGGLRAALPLLGNGPVYTMNPDVIWQGPNPLLLLRQSWRPDKMDALLMCVPMGRTIGHSGGGDFATDANGRISRGDDLVYGGVQIVKTDRLDDIHETAFSLNVLWDMIADQNRLYYEEYPGYWCDVGSAKGIVLAEKLLATPDV